MKLSRQLHLKAPAKCVGGTSLIEFLIALGIFSFIITGLVVANLLGLKEDQLMESKAGASDSSRLMLETMLQDIHMANSWDIGNISTFGTISSNYFVVDDSSSSSNLVGNALRLYPDTNSVSFIIYYFDTSTQTDEVLWRWVSTNSAATIICSNLINTTYFDGEDYRGVTKEVNDNPYLVVHTTLHFCQFQYPTTLVGYSNALYSSYTMDFRATPYLPQRVF
jgi:hypothetical protein